jgi:hypothetical protein
MHQISRFWSRSSKITAPPKAMLRQQIVRATRPVVSRPLCLRTPRSLPLSTSVLRRAEAQAEAAAPDPRDGKITDLKV